MFCGADTPCYDFPMIESLQKWPLRLAYFKFGVGLLLLIGLIVAYLSGTDRPRTFYVAIAATAFAAVFWGIKIVLLRRPNPAP